MSNQFSEIQVVIPFYCGSLSMLNNMIFQLFKHSLLEVDVLILLPETDNNSIEEIRCNFRDYPKVEVKKVNVDLKRNYYLSAINYGRHHSDKILLHPSSSLAKGWDKKLKSAAYKNSNVLTVSSMINDSSFFGLIIDSFLVDNNRFDTQTVNVFIEQNFTDRLIDIPIFSPVCCYFSGHNLDKLGRDFFSSTDQFFDSSSSMGLVHALTNQLCVPSNLHWNYNIFVGRKFANIASKLELRSPLTAERDLIKRSFQSYIPGIVSTCQPTQLHVMHSWGGGLEKWVRDYTKESEWNNLILKSIGYPGAFGSKIGLFTSIDSTEPIELWEFNQPIPSTSISHIEYQQAIDEIIKKYRIDFVLISSFIGHSLDIIKQTVPTYIVCHDYFPYCSALNIYYDRVCTHCDNRELAKCLKFNTRNKFFNGVIIDEWLGIRENFLSTIIKNQIPLVCPTKSIEKYYRCLDQRFEKVNFKHIPHGLPECGRLSRVKVKQGKRARLRVLVLGRLTDEKGAEFFDSIFDELIKSVDLFLVGCGENGKKYSNKENVSVIFTYNHIELNGILDEISPDLGILFSSCPETFSYTLHELIDAAIPSLAPRIGAFNDKIKHRQNGFLFNIDRESLFRVLSQIDFDRNLLMIVKKNLMNYRHRTINKMLEDYHNMFDKIYYPRADLSLKDNKEVANVVPKNVCLIETNDLHYMMRSFMYRVDEKIDQSRHSTWIKMVSRVLFRFWFFLPSTFLSIWEKHR